MRNGYQSSNSGIECRCTRYEPNSSLARHCHDATNLVLTLSGSYEHAPSGRATHFQPRGLLYLPAGESHSNRFGERGTSCFIVTVSGTWIGRRLETCRTEAAIPKVCFGGDISQLALRMYDELKNQDPLSELIIEGLFLELLGRWFREGRGGPGHAPDWLRSVRDLLHDSFRENVSLSQIAQQVGVHPSHLAREFHRVYGETAGEYVRKLRVDFVSERLRNSAAKKHSLTDLALEAGFSSHAHMSFFFKRATGMTPSQYRKGHGIPSIR
jgi:AraC family transcriptional regulator